MRACVPKKCTAFLYAAYLRRYSSQLTVLCEKFSVQAKKGLRPNFNHKTSTRGMSVPSSACVEQNERGTFLKMSDVSDMSKLHFGCHPAGQLVSSLLFL